jgi:hypothetical protein
MLPARIYGVFPPARGISEIVVRGRGHAATNRHIQHKRMPPTHQERIMTFKNIALSLGLAAALVGCGAFAANPERNDDWAMQLAMQTDMDHNGMVTKAEYMKMMEMKWDKMANGAKQLSVSDTAKIFMDGYKAQ